MNVKIMNFSRTKLLKIIHIHGDDISKFVKMISAQMAKKTEKQVMGEKCRHLL